MDKQLIAERFARARATYSREARVQQQVAEKMTALLRRTLPDARFDRIVEFGCGTGLYSQLIMTRGTPRCSISTTSAPKCASAWIA